MSDSVLSSDIPSTSIVDAPEARAVILEIGLVLAAHLALALAVVLLV